VADDVLVLRFVGGMLVLSAMLFALATMAFGVSTSSG
jgi:hypothetical protein